MKKLASFAFGICVAFCACTSEEVTSEGSAIQQSHASAPKDPLGNLPGLASPVQLEGIESTVYLADYFMDPSLIDSVGFVPGLDIQLDPAGQELQIRIVGDLGFLSNLTFYSGEDRYDLLLRSPVKIPVTLRLRDKDYQRVQVKGEMNAWNPAAGEMTMNRGIWEISFQANPGNYQYQFVVDGREMLDPINPKTTPNGIGGINSLLSLPRPDTRKVPALYSRYAYGDSLELQLVNDGAVLVYWENELIPIDKKGGRVLIRVPEKARERSRSFLRVYAQNEFGVSNDVLIPLEKGEVLTNPADITRHDREAQIMYFTLVDRFNNGNSENDAPVNDERVLPMANYQGGDIAGITQKIKDGYFKSMHINAIWLSPITLNPEGAFQEHPEPRRWYTGYHGYWPVRSSALDHRFGTEEDMQELVETAHAHGINILLDYVCNHVHEQHPIYQRNPDWATPLTLPDGTKNIRIWEEQRLTTWFDDFLPTLDLENPEVIALQVDSAMYWVKRYGLDGYRHDATKHISTPFWRTLTRRLKEQVMVPNNQLLYQIGETYGSRELTASYIGSGLLDAQFDFNLYFDAREVFARPETSFDLLYNSMLETFSYFGYHSTMGYISGNHDIPRFISLAGGALRFDENDRAAGFEREVGVGDPSAYKRLQMLHAFNMSIPGVPVIYYGDEIGMPGAGDPDNRRMMRFDSWSGEEEATKKIVEKLSALRKSQLALIYGNTEFLHRDASSMAFARTYFNQLTVTVFNKSDKPKRITLTIPERYSEVQLLTNFGHTVTQKGTQIQIELPPLSFEILTHL
jgi:cyclomaltodextrinase